MYTVVSLFSGCGGLDLGFKEHGFDLRLAVDHDPRAVEVYRRNLNDHAVVLDVLDPTFLDTVTSVGHADVVLGGFPCQGFSKAGPKRTDDVRNTLYLQMRAAVKALQPQIFIAENVDGLSQNFGGVFVEMIVNDFSELGYQVKVKLLDAVAYGVAQHRRRIIFVGVRHGSPEFEWPSPTHVVPARNGEAKLQSETIGLWEDLSRRNELLPCRTIRDAIGDLPDLGAVPDHRVTNKWPKEYEHIFRAIGPGQKLCNVRHSSTSVYTWNIPEVYGHTTPFQKEILETIAKNRRRKIYGDIPNGNPIPVDALTELMSLKEAPLKDLKELETLGYLKRIDDGFDLKGAMFCSGIFKRALWDAPSPTVLTNFHNPRYFLHPEENRPFTLRECARLQGFPDDFLFDGDNDSATLVAGYRLVGNAVPPPLSRKLAAQVKKFLTTNINISQELYET